MPAGDLYTTYSDPNLADTAAAAAPAAPPPTLAPFGGGVGPFGGPPPPADWSQLQPASSSSMPASGPDSQRSGYGQPEADPQAAAPAGPSGEAAGATPAQQPPGGFDDPLAMGASRAEDDGMTDLDF